MNTEILNFLSELKENNNKDWFDSNRARYKELREYFIDQIAILIDKVAEFDPIVKLEDPRKSVFRINRDIRFSNDKSPYKTNFGGYIVPGGKKGGGAGYYLHFEPNSSFIGGGIYCPPNPTLKRIRWGIYQNIDEFLPIISEKEFKKAFGGIVGSKLVNPPKGFDKDFEHIDLLKFKDYNVIVNFEDKQIVKDDFIDKVVDYFKKMISFNQFLNKVVEE
ncbi:MAG: DUF2461 domain-containing protein [Bacteroidales bacterium]|nr:DUF2461 domain-containing protein [Bacteroidales bacterium]